MMSATPWLPLAAMIAPRRLQSFGTLSLQPLAMTSSVRSTFNVAARAGISVTRSHVKQRDSSILTLRALLGWPLGPPLHGFESRIPPKGSAVKAADDEPITVW